MEKERVEKAAKAAAEKEARRAAYESERERLKEEQARARHSNRQLGATRRRQPQQCQCVVVAQKSTRAVQHG